MKVCVVGIGYIGLPLSCLISDSGHMVLGVDINNELVEETNKGNTKINEFEVKNLLAKSIKNKRFKAGLKIAKSDVFIICVPTPFSEDYSPDLSYLFNALDNVIEFLMPNNLLIIESTIPTGVIKEIETIILSNSKHIQKMEELNIAYCPERTYPSNIIYELINNNRVLGGNTKKASEKARIFYRTFSKGKLIETNAATSELCKLAENSYRDVNIAFANEISLICEKLNINPKELINLTNMHPRVNIHSPGPGVGGHCIPIDPWFIVNKFPNQSKIIKVAREVNKSKENWVTKKIIDFIENKNIQDIFILGMTYKPNVNDFRESPSLNIVKNIDQYIDKKKINIFCVDPFIGNLTTALPSRIILKKKVEIKENSLYVILVNHNSSKKEIEDLNNYKRINIMDFT